MNTRQIQDSIDERLPVGRSFLFGLQHVLVMYAGAVTVPLILGSALGLSQEDIAILINADLLCCGIISIIQSMGVARWVGIRLPVMMGISFAGIAPMIAIGLTPGMGLPALYGAIIAAGFIAVLMVPLIIRLLWLFPPLVTGTTLVSLGVGLFGVAITWAGGGHGAKDFGSLVYLGIAGTVLLVTLLVARFGRGFFGSIAVLVGLAAGMILAILMGRVTVEGLDQLPWIELVTPFHFGMPTFSFSATFTMLLVVIVTMVEAIGLFYALAVILNRPLSHEDFARGLRADALGAVIGGVFNTFPYSSYAQNIGLIGVTGVRSRYVCLVAGLILIVLGLVPRIAHVVALVPHYVLGGAAIVMFGMVAASGVRILQTVDFKNNKHNTFIFAISLGVGLIPAVAPTFFDQFPEYLIPLLHSGVLLTVISSVVLNLFFNGTSGRQHTEELVMETQEETPLSVVRVTPQG